MARFIRKPGEGSGNMEKKKPLSAKAERGSEELGLFVGGAFADCGLGGGEAGDWYSER